MKTKIVNIIGLLSALAMFLVLLSSLIKSVKRINEGQNIIEKNKVRLEKINEENEKLKAQVNTIQSDEYMEKQLRDKLGLAKEGEIVIVMPEAEIVKKLSPVIPEEEVIKPKTNWQKWMELFK